MAIEPGCSLRVLVFPILAFLPISDIKEHPFAKLTGPYPVGTQDYHWIDEDREEIFSKAEGDKRHVLVQVWYPAEPVQGNELASYVRNQDEFEGTELSQVFHVKSRSLSDAPLSTRQERYPVLIFHHGGGWTRFSSSFLTEELASHGYVVFGVDHLGFNQTRKLPDGSRVVLDAVTAPKTTGDPYSDGLRSFEYLETQHFPVWMKDSRFVLDRIEELNDSTNERFFDRLDLERIGMFGWSFGGATSIQASRDDSRVKAAVDLDGQLFGDVAERGTARPFMLMHAGAPLAEVEWGESSDAMRRLIELVRSRDLALRENSKADWYDITIEGTQHGYFSDLVLFYPKDPMAIDAAQAHRIICDYTLAFFDKYLKGLDVEFLVRERGPPGVTITSQRDTEEGK
jgi:dienelactone hydrolase